MSTDSAARVRPADSVTSRRVGAIGFWAGLVGAASGLFLIGYPAAVDDGRYSYPFTATGFAIAQTVFFAQHVCLVVLLAGLLTSGAAGRSGLGRIGVGGSMLAMLGLAAVELAAISARDSLYPSPRTDTLDVWYGVTSIAIGVFLIVAGIAVLRAKVWAGWQRYLPLVLGIYVFVPLTPGILGPFVVGRLVITVWMALFALLGWVLMRQPARRL